MDQRLLDRAEEIMQEGLKTAGDLLLEKPRVAEMILRQVLKCDPEHQAALELLGICKHHLGQHEESIEVLQTALEMNPDSPDLWNNLGLAYGAIGKHDKAIECGKKAVVIRPVHYFYSNLGLHYICKGDYETAIQTMKEALSHEVTPQTLANLGCAYGEMGQIERAREYFQEAIKADPTYPVPHVELAFSHFLEGDWENGFREYEWRFHAYHQMSYYLKEYDQTKRWDGKASLSGKRFLIYMEQGIGDAIQFVRYARKLKGMGAYVMVHAHEALDLIFGRLEWVDEVVVRDISTGQGDEYPEYDYQCSSISLPYLLQDFEIVGTPYIEPATRKFREHIAQDYGGTFNIGIVWAGSPSHPNDRNRSIPLKHFEKISKMDGVRLFSLQLDTRPRKYTMLHRETGGPCMFRTSFDTPGQVVDFSEGAEEVKMVDLAPMIQSMEDTATIIAGLDLVIMCDTSPVHLAGAMGVPCWMLLPFSPDWRWGTNSDQTPWYDSVKIFRQSERGNWKQVFEEVEKKVREKLSEH